MTPALVAAFLAAGAVNLVLIGAPIVATTHALLAVGDRWSARTHYRVAVFGFVLAFGVPLVCAWPRGTPADPPGQAVVSPAARLADVPFGLLLAGALAWLVGAAWLVGREARSWRHLGRAARQWRPVPSGVLRSRGLPLDVHFVTGGGVGPMAVGWRRPVAVLPTWVWRLPDPALRALAAHEAAHVRWRDPAIHQLSRLALALLWPFAHLRLAYGRVRLEREAAADAEAVRALGATSEPEIAWAEVLLAAARRARVDPLVAVGAASELERRLDRLLDPRPPSRTGVVAGLAVASAALALSLLVGVSAPRGPTATTGERWTVVDHLRGHNAVVRFAARPAASELTTDLDRPDTAHHHGADGFRVSEETPRSEGALPCRPSGRSSVRSPSP